MCLFDKDGMMIDEHGKEHSINYAFYADYVYSNGLEFAQKTLKDFQESSETNLDLGKQNLVDLPGNQNFGAMLKCAIAWNGIQHEVLSESGFFSIAHILEAGAELDCSILLATMFYYKHALQVLRNFMEDIVVQLYFCNKQSNYQKWKESDFRVPSFRGRGGMLEELGSHGFLSSGSVQIGSDLYGELNSAIHGAERRLIYEGIYEGKATGLIFKLDRLEEWCNYFGRCVDFGIHALYEHLIYWKTNKPPEASQCDVCHSRGNFAFEDYEIAGRRFRKRICQGCGTVITFDGNSSSSNGYYEVTHREK